VRRDWGYAKDYVEAMWMMLQRDSAEDFVIGTGVAHSVRDVVNVAFGSVGLDPEDYVRTESSLERPAEIQEVVADPSKARRELGWSANVSFEELIEMMVKADLKELSQTPSWL
jgi:GDPmannose 4,6-dehydratase